MENSEWRVEHFDVRVDVPRGQYTRLIRKSNPAYPVMNDTPAELCDLDPLLEKATGRILVNGLGLGVVVASLLAKPEVSHIDVVEISGSLIEMLSPFYAGERVTLYHDSAFLANWPINTWWHAVWHDIWDDLSPNNLIDMQRLRKKYHPLADWQGCWGEVACMQLGHR